MAKENLGHFLEGQSRPITKKRLDSELDNAAVWMTYSVKEDSTGLDM